MNKKLLLNKASESEIIGRLECIRGLRNDVRKNLNLTKERHYTSVCQSLSKYPRKVERLLNPALRYKHCRKITCLEAQ